MSDIVDDCNGVADLVAGGARFKARKAETARRPCGCVTCGSRPLFVAEVRSKEVMACPNGCRRTQPLGSRQRLIAERNDINK